MDYGGDINMYYPSLMSAIAYEMLALTGYQEVCDNISERTEKCVTCFGLENFTGDCFAAP
jgi:hypothetical protein